jgi:TatD DNase family protein
MFIDGHCHLDFPDFADDLDAVLDRARLAGIGGFVTISVRVRQFSRVLRVAEAYPNVYCTVGTLPHYAEEERDVTTEELVRIARHPKVVGIGECGYDRYFGNAAWDDQLTVFARHIAAARATQLPLIIHSVREDEALARTLVAEARKGSFPIVMHSFSGQRAMAETALSLGAYISFSALLTYEENAHLREIAPRVPAERLLVETDSPSQNPGADREARNEPANLLVTAELLASLRGTGLEELGRTTSENFYRVFARIPAPFPNPTGGA